jgi:hypothetical protein
MPRVCLALLIFAGSRSFAQVANEYEVKAAFLYKFASFVEWPEEPGALSESGNSERQPAGSRRCIGIVGQDPFGAVLDDTVAGKFAVRRFKPGQESDGCQILFLGASERRRLRAVLGRLRHAAVLTVGDMPGFCEQGGMINLGLADHRIRLEINPEAASRARLQLSSKLLSLARIVHESVQACQGKP